MNVKVETKKFILFYIRKSDKKTQVFPDLFDTVDEALATGYGLMANNECDFISLRFVNIPQYP